MRRTNRLLLLVIPAAMLMGAVALAFYAAQRTLSRSAGLALKAHQRGYTLQAIDLRAGLRGAEFEPVGSPAGYRSAVFLHQDLYLAGPGGLDVYGPDRRLRYRLRTGVELPVEQVVAMAAGRPRGSPDSEVLLGTAGAGLLLLAPGGAGQPTLRQLRPAAAVDCDVTALLALPSGDVLLGTRRGGVLVYDGSTLMPLTLNVAGASGGAQVSAAEVTALAAGDGGAFLVGTRAAGLFYAHGGTLQHLDERTGLPDARVESILVAEGKAYVGTPLGIAEVGLSEADFGVERVLAPGLFGHALWFDAATKQLSIGTLDEGVVRVPVDAAAHLRHASIAAPRDAAVGAADERIEQFLLQQKPVGALYALANGELVRRAGEGWERALPVGLATLTDRNISALAFAPDGSLYVGFFDHGLDILPPGTLAPGDVGATRHMEDDHLFCINRLVLDPQRRTMAAATANGLVLFDAGGTARQVLTRRDGLISDHITDAAFTRDGMALATPAGLSFVGPGGTESLYAFQGLVNNHVYALGARAESGGLLAGTLGGLSMLEARAVRRNLTVANSGLRHNWITAVLPMEDGGYLVGTYGAGVERMSAAGVVTTVDLPAGVARDLIVNPNSLFAASGHVYAGTLDHGMLVFSAATGRWSNVVEGLPSRNVTAFAERDGELYVGTANGLVRIAELKLEARIR